jgi:hypothetical protein
VARVCTSLGERAALLRRAGSPGRRYRVEAEANTVFLDGNASLIANAGVIDHTGEAAVVASERCVALDGFRALGATAAPPAPTRRALVAAMRRWLA